MQGIEKESTGPSALEVRGLKRKRHVDGERGFLTTVPRSAAPIMFMSMCSGQELDKLTGPDSRIKPKSQAQWHINCNRSVWETEARGLFQVQGQSTTDCNRGRRRPAQQSRCDPGIHEAGTAGSNLKPG